MLARHLGLPADGLIARLMAAMAPRAETADLARRARAAGIRTGLLSNSWGAGGYDVYTGYDLAAMFDVVVISHLVGSAEAGAAHLRTGRRAARRRARRLRVRRRHAAQRRHRQGTRHGRGALHRRAVAAGRGRAADRAARRGAARAGDGRWLTRWRSASGSRRSPSTSGSSSRCRAAAGATRPSSTDETGAIWRTSLTPDGPATIRVLPGRPVAETAGPATRVRAQAWGPGAQWLLDALPGVLGGDDDVSGFASDAHPVIRDAARRNPGTAARPLRPPDGGARPRDPGAEGRRPRGAPRLADPARQVRHAAAGPAPRGMRVFPDPRTWRRIPSWDWHRAGVEGVRAETIIRAATVADSLERLLKLTHEEADRKLRTIPGIGVWTSAEARQRAAGDPDAVSVGDYHLKNVVGWALAGKDRSTDEEMLALLEPFKRPPAPGHPADRPQPRQRDRPGAGLRQRQGWHSPLRHGRPAPSRPARLGPRLPEFLAARCRLGMPAKSRRRVPYGSSYEHFEHRSG